MDFFDNVVNKSNAIIKERLNNPFGGAKQQAEQPGGDGHIDQPNQENQPTANANNDIDTTNLVESSQNKRASQDSAGESDRNAQFANIAADAEAVAQKAAKGAKTFGTFLFSMANKAGQTVSQTAKQVKQAVESTSILTDFTREQQDFIREHGGSLQAGKLPWDEVEDEQKSAYIKEQILTLSQDKRNFVRAPPNETDFKFDSQTSYPIALSLLKEDPNLNKMRYELVPKLVNEDTFWCNYFYRVSMLKQMSERGTDAKKGWASSRSSSGEGPDEVGEQQGASDEPPLSPGYNSDAQQQTSSVKQQDSFNLVDKINISDKEDPSLFGGSESLTTFTPAAITSQQLQQGQYQSSELESTESRKLVAEADDLKSKLRELNIGSLDESQDG
jgi:hypothetical protein